MQQTAKSKHIMDHNSIIAHLEQRSKEPVDQETRKIGYWNRFDEFKKKREYQSYSSKVKAFMEFCDAHNLPVDEKGYLTPDNVSCYYQEVIAKKDNCLESSLTKYTHAFNRLAKVLENRGSRYKIHDFDGVECAIKLAGKTNRELLRTRPAEHQLTDPSRVISYDHELQMMRFALDNLDSHTSIEFMTSWNIMARSWLRTINLLPLMWKDVSPLQSPYTPFPKQCDGLPMNCGLKFNCGVTKTKVKVTATGCIRHRHVLLCPISSVSFQVMFTLKDMVSSRIDAFFQPTNQSERFSSPFLEQKLVKFETYNSLSLCFVKCFEGASIPSRAKVCYNRRDFMTRAHMDGLVRADSALLSHHATQRMDGHYLPQMPKNALHANAGFLLSPQREPYFVPRCLLHIETNWYVFWSQSLLPCLNDLKLQLEQVPKEELKEVEVFFLKRMIPTYLKVILQDGVYYLEHHPNHMISTHLRNLPGYKTWAEHARKAEKLLQYLYDTSVEGYQEKCYATGQFVFTDLRKTVPIACMPQDVRECVDPSNPALSPEMKVPIEHLQRQLRFLTVSPECRYNRYLNDMGTNNNIAFSQLMATCIADAVDQRMRMVMRNFTFVPNCTNDNNGAPTVVENTQDLWQCTNDSKKRSQDETATQAINNEVTNFCKRQKVLEAGGFSQTTYKLPNKQMPSSLAAVVEQHYTLKLYELEGQDSSLYGIKTNKEKRQLAKRHYLWRCVMNHIKCKERRPVLNDLKKGAASYQREHGGKTANTIYETRPEKKKPRGTHSKKKADD